jgi:hypothetical protein
MQTLVVGFGLVGLVLMGTVISMLVSIYEFIGLHTRCLLALYLKVR